MLIALLLSLSFMVGYAIRRGTICAVVATQALIVERRSARFRAFGVAAAGAGSVIIPLHWLFPAETALSAGYPATWIVVLAGAMFGLGARLNNACVLGTLSHVTGGNLSFAFSILGMIFGAISATALSSPSKDSILPTASFLEAPSLAANTFVVILAASLIAALYRRVPRWVRGLRDPGSTRMGPYRAMLVIGISGGLLYTLAGNWTYMSVLSHRAMRPVDPSLTVEGWSVAICATTVVIGGITAALRYDDFELRLPRLKTNMRCFAGGSIMGAAAAIIPGGNATMLIHGLPSLAPHAIAAYLAMTVVLCMSFLVRQPAKTA